MVDSGFGLELWAEEERIANSINATLTEGGKVLSVSLKETHVDSAEHLDELKKFKK